MALPLMKYVLLVFCLCGSTNILYLLVSNSHATTKLVYNMYNMQIIPLATTKETAHETPTLMKHTLDVRNLKATDELESVTGKKEEVNVNKLGKFTFRMHPYFVCDELNETDKATFELIVIVISDVKHFLRRMTIRNTWGSDVYDTLQYVRLVFMVGSRSDSGFQPQIEKESELFKDVIQVNVDEVYENLTNKSLALLQWVRDYCNKTRFVLKVDDDVYINLPNLLNELKRRKEPEFFLCYVFRRAPPVRDKNSRWYTSVEDYRYEFFPNYCSGTAYAFSSVIATHLFETSKSIKLLKMEDVYVTGLLAQRIDIPLIHNDGFWFLKRKSSGCDYKTAISGHEVPMRDMYIIHSELKDTAIDCDRNINSAITGDDNDMFQKWQQSDVT